MYYQLIVEKDISIEVRDGTIEKQPAVGSTIPIPEMLSLYYQKRGRTPQGVPTPEKRKELGVMLR